MGIFIFAGIFFCLIFFRWFDAEAFFTRFSDYFILLSFYFYLESVTIHSWWYRCFSSIRVVFITNQFTFTSYCQG